MTTRLHRCVCGHQNGSHEENLDDQGQVWLFGLCLIDGCDCEEYRPAEKAKLGKPFVYTGPVGLDAKKISGHRRRSGTAW